MRMLISALGLLAILVGPGILGMGSVVVDPVGTADAYHSSGKLNMGIVSPDSCHGPYAGHGGTGVCTVPNDHGCPVNRGLCQ